MIFEWIKDMFVSSIQEPAGVITKPVKVNIELDLNDLDNYPHSLVRDDLLLMSKLQLECYAREFLNVELDRRNSHEKLVNIVFELLQKKA